ncbi:MAG: DUF2752 domain-containing protein [Deltaproteobacteria bacterium]|nr:DUF2752 domain-containing protein [Deltaproteobacteria bacterium]
MKEATIERPRHAASTARFRVTLLAMIAGGWVWAYIVPWKLVYETQFCPFLNLSGLPCPFCGLTRSCVAFASGRFAESWMVNPLGPVVMAASVVFAAAVIGLLAWNRPALRPDAFLKRHRAVLPAALGLWTLNWILMIFRAL